jgi:hypothetical protein
MIYNRLNDFEPKPHFAARVIETLGDNSGVFLPSIRALMAQAWEEGFDYARNDSWREDSNPYGEPPARKVPVPEDKP